jgi:cytidylate kinase
MKNIAVAIDGPSGAGKSTIARAVAKQMGFLYVDTGAMYRTIGLYMHEHSIAGDDPVRVPAALPEVHMELRYEKGVQKIWLDGRDVSEEIRTPIISRYASQVSAIQPVRDFLLETQRDMAKKHSVIMDGRDIGTVILPDAQVKIFLTASPEKRAQRRYEELVEKGEKVTLEQVLADMRQRDEKDEKRSSAPLKQAEDAVLVDTSDLTLEESIAAITALIQEKAGV